MLCSFHKNGPEIEFSEIAKIWLDKFRKMKYNNSRKSRHATVAQLVEQLIRNQQVVCSSHITSSRNALWSLAAGHFCTLPLDAAAGARYNKIYIEPFGTALLFSY